MAAVVGRIRDRSTLRALRRPAGKAARGPIRVSYVPARGPEGERFAQVGYVVGRRCGNAVHRNRLRRRCRAAARAAVPGLAAGSYLIRPEPDAAALPYADLARAVAQAMAAAAGRAGAR
jgi:ribonuclease P protein component